jgi:LmbE family N-acetylglucosaminyl deacetylase
MEAFCYEKHVWSARALMNKRVIVFAPHPDDETFGCGGTIAKKISEGYEVFVVVLTDGRYAFSRVLNVESNPSPEEVKCIRREEVTQAMNALGLPTDNLSFLEFEDGKLKAHEKEVKEKIFEMLEKFPPFEVYYPMERDGHPDHQAANRILRSCLNECGLKPIRYQYSVFHKFRRLGPRIERVFDIYNDCIVDVDVSQYLDVKKKACSMFKSEISIISNEQKRPVVKDIARFLRSKERFYIDKS